MDSGLIKKLSGIAALVLLLAVSLTLAFYARWSYRLEQADRLLRAGDYAAAESLYARAAQPFEQHPELPSLLREDYRRLVHRRARLLYAERRDDELSRMLEQERARAAFLAEDSEVSFWTATVLLRHALAQSKTDAAREDLRQAAGAYRRALVASPGDWDAKYNYELATRLLAKMEKGKSPEGRPGKEQMKLLREGHDQDRPKEEKLPSNKRG